MSRAFSPINGKPYGLAAVCRAWRLARSSIYRHLSPSPATPPRRRGPRGVMIDDALTTAIRGVLANSHAGHAATTAPSSQTPSTSCGAPT